MGETSKKVTAGPVANSKRVKATTSTEKPKKATTKAPAKKKVTEAKVAKEITELKSKGAVQAPKEFEKVINAKKLSVWQKVKKALGL